MKRVILLTLVMVGLFLLAGQVLAMNSTNYRLDWFTPLTGASAGSATSTNYAVQFTVGQSAYQASASTNYGVCLGYWCGGSSTATRRLYLPLVMRG